MDIVPTKVCKVCGEAKPATLEYWHKHYTNKGGLRHECKPCHNASRREYIELHKAAHSQSTAQWHKRNKEATRVKRRKHYLDNKEAVNAQNKAYYQANPQVAMESWRRRRARLAEIPGMFTAAEFASKLELYKGRCHWCGEKIKGTPHADHLIPIHPKDGNAPGSNWISNIVPSCSGCNKAKRDKMPWEFMPGRLL